MSKSNKGFNAEEIQKLQGQMKESGRNYVTVETEDNSEEYQNVYFLGQHENKEVIYDAAIYTLRMLHNSQIFELAEQKTEEKFPHYKGMDEEDAKLTDAEEEEIGLFMAEVMDDLEEEESVKVREQLEVDAELDFGIGLDIALNVEEIDAAVIEKFIEEFNTDQLKLDPTLYSFQLDEDDD